MRREHTNKQTYLLFLLSLELASLFGAEFGLDFRGVEWFVAFGYKRPPEALGELRVGNL